MSLGLAIVLVAHMFEEERFPGGFAYAFNVVRGRSEAPDRYPMSPLIAMVVDVTVWLVLLVPALFLPEVIWLGMAPMFLGVMELVTHGSIGVAQRRTSGMSLYNPGLATALVLATIGVWFIVVASTGGLMSGLGWLWAVLYFVGAMAVGLVLREQGLKSTTARWGLERDRFLGFYGRYTTVEEALGPDPETAGLRG